MFCFVSIELVWLRGSPVAHADETSWRQDGQNRTLWVVSTPTARYFEIGRRTNGQIDAILGAAFAEVLVTVFYSADHRFGLHQRSCAHLLRELRDLVAAHPQDEKDWVAGVGIEPTTRGL